MKILAIANHKGGVGKTATAHALGAALSSRGRRVLLVDLDPQASLTGACGLADHEGPTMADVMGDARPGHTSIEQIALYLGPGLSLAPSGIELAGAELGLVPRMGRESVLRKALAQVGGAYDLAIVDCPPALGLLTVNGLAAAGAVIVPTQAQAVDLRALKLFLETLDSMRAELNPGLETLGILVTFFNPRLTHHREAVAAMRAAGLPVLDLIIGRSIRLAEAAAAGESIITFAADSPIVPAYQQLAEIVDQWLKRKAT